MDIPARSRKKMKEKGHMVKRISVGAELHHLDEDKSVTTDPGENNKRRTLRLEKKEGSWGFTLQSYGIKHKKTNEIEIMTYIDYVEYGSAAWYAGMRKGDVILSVNGEKVSEVNHQQLVNKIKQAGQQLRLVVLFEDCCRKVELHERFLKLKAVLKSKYQELKDIEQKEMQILDKYYQSKGINRFEQIRHSIMSNVSSNSDSWDAYSMISSPNGMLSTGHYTHSQWSSVTSLKSFSVDDASSLYEEQCSYIDSESDNDGALMMSLDHQGNRLQNYSSDSNLVKYDSLPKVKDFGRLRMSRSSDSKLYRRSLSPLMPGSRSLFKNKNESEDSIADDVFEQEKVTLDSCTERDLTLQKNKMYYAGENGNIIVPKICVEGDKVYTTFDEIDTNDKENVTVSKIDLEAYQDKIVAIEIAKEMAKLEKIKADQKQTAMEIPLEQVNNSEVTDNDSNQTPIESVGRIPNGIGNEKMSPSQLGKLSENSGAGKVLQSDMQSNGAVLKNSSSLKNFIPGSRKFTLPRSERSRVQGVGGTGSHNLSSPRTEQSLVPGNGEAGAQKSTSPKSERSLLPGIGGSMSYEELKSSVPDIRVSFHTDECEVIYINDKDESTRL